MRRLVWLVLVGTLGAFNCAAQVGGMGQTSPTTGAGGQTSVQANPNLGSGGGALSPNTTRPIYISGHVVMEDHSAPSPNIAIERVCGGIAKTVAYADSNGRFSFQWQDRSAIVADASDAGSGRARGSSSAGYGSAQSAGGANALAADPFGNRMMNCELRANLAGFTSSVVNLFNRRIADSPDVGAVILHRVAGVDGSSVSVTSMKAPKDARKAYDHGLQALLKNKPQDAAKDFERAVVLYPKYADAWFNLGKLQLEQKSVDSARTSWTKAIDADPRLVTPYIELGLLAATDANWQDSGKYLDRAVALDPIDFPQAWYADAVANYNLKNYDAAEKAAREALKLDPRRANPRSGYLLGLVLAEKRDYAGAATELATYMKLAPNAPDLAQVKDQLAELEKLIGTAK